MKRQLIALIGEAQTGKDTICKLMIGMGWPVTRRAFADELKLEMQAWLKQAYGIDPMTATSEQKAMIRDLLVAHGRCRRQQHPAYWIIALAKRMSLVPGRCQVITDCRYPNEAEWARARGALLVRVKRPGFGPANDEEKESIKDIDNSGLSMVELCNDGSEEDLQIKVIKIMLEVDSERVNSR